MDGESQKNVRTKRQTLGSVPRFLSLRNTFRVTIDAPHRMNVVRTLAVGECRVHLCHIELAVRDGRMTILAALLRIVAMVVVACQAADPFMNTSRRPIVAGSRLMECTGSVALKTNALKEIVRNLDLPSAVPYCRRRQVGSFNVILFVPVIKKCFRKVSLSLIKYLLRIGRVCRNCGSPFAVDFVTGQAWDHRLS